LRIREVLPRFRDITRQKPLFGAPEYALNDVPVTWCWISTSRAATGAPKGLWACQRCWAGPLRSGL